MGFPRSKEIRRSPRVAQIFFGLCCRHFICSGVPIFRASSQVQARIETLLIHQQESSLTSEEVEELDRYEEIDDYLSHLNRVVRNLLQSQEKKIVPRPGVLTNRIKQQVRQRARFMCEHCHTSERWQYVPFTVDHVVPVAKGGQTELDNLALACFHCNRRKSDLVTAVDPQTNEVVPLFNPRLDKWREHFVWSIDGLTIVA